MSFLTLNRKSKDFSILLVSCVIGIIRISLIKAGQPPKAASSSSSSSPPTWSYINALPNCANASGKFTKGEALDAPHRTSTIIECGIGCLRDERCASFNFIQFDDNVNSMCYLYSNQASSCEDLAIDHDYSSTFFK